jgi:hypothetical protein
MYNRETVLVPAGTNGPNPLVRDTDCTSIELQAVNKVERVTDSFEAAAHFFRTALVKGTISQWIIEQRRLVDVKPLTLHQLGHIGKWAKCIELRKSGVRYASTRKHSKSDIHGSLRG